MYIKLSNAITDGNREVEQLLQIYKTLVNRNRKL